MLCSPGSAFLISMALLLLPALAGVQRAGDRPLRIRGRRIETREDLTRHEVEVFGLDQTEHEYRADLGLFRRSRSGPLEVDTDDLRERSLDLYEGRSVSEFHESRVLVPTPDALADGPSAARAAAEAETGEPGATVAVWAFLGLLLGVGLVLRRRFGSGHPH